jgi:hypothetical protein
MLVFGSAGLLLAGSLIGLPLSLGAAAFSVPQENVLKWLTYSSPLWAPIGFGMGAVAASFLTRGIRRNNPKKTDDAT